MVAMPQASWRALLLTLALATCLCGVTHAQDASVTDSPASAASAAVEAQAPETPVVIWNRKVIDLHAAFRGTPPAERARAASKRINAVLDTLQPDAITVGWTEVGADHGAVLRADNLVLFAVLPGDVDSEDRPTIERAAGAARERLVAILTERAQAKQPKVLLRAILLGIAATIILALLCWLLAVVNRRMQARLIRAAQAHLKLEFGGFDLRPVMWSLLRRTVGLVHLLLILFATYLWLSFVLRQFPYSRPWGTQLGGYLVDVATGVAAAFVGQIPNLITLVIIFLVTRGLIRIVGAWFRAVESGTVQVTWLEAPTASVTRRLASFFIWLFALIVAYPYIPGANTDAFKGVSVFLGLMLSLGSAGIVNQVMSGLVVLYSRAVRAGDFIRVADHEGTVLALGALSLKMITRKREEITVPNSVLSSSTLQNLTRQSGSEGLLLTTMVTIGYDTPWRQVVALLELAASRTEGLLTTQRPFVLQSSLSDYYIEYQLNVATLSPSQHLKTEAALNRQIIDAFNEFGVQIMSPHFHHQPHEKVWVPVAQWHEPPADRNQG
jgi:small-conductance mechanosensitive channel